MLVQLRKRLRSGGVLIIVEWLNAVHHSHGHAHGHGHGHHDHHQQHSSGLDVHGGQMIETVGGQQIWPGFTMQAVFERGLIAAGFEKETVEVRNSWSYF